jgi:DNA-binding XRE family transcriptional regulator
MARVSRGQKEKAWRMYKKHSVAEIAKSLHIPYIHAWLYTEGRNRGFHSFHEYNNFLAQQKGHANRTQYEESLKYRRKTSLRLYRKQLAQRKGYTSISVYKEYWAAQKGYISYADYCRDLIEKRKKRKSNQCLSKLMRRRLQELGKSQYWLAYRVGVSNQAVNQFACGRTFPRAEVFKKILSALEVNCAPKNLEHLLE